MNHFFRRFGIFQKEKYVLFNIVVAIVIIITANTVLLLLLLLLVLYSCRVMIF